MVFQFTNMEKAELSEIVEEDISIISENAPNISNEVLLSTQGNILHTEAQHEEENNMVLNDNVINILHSRVLRDLRVIFNRKVEEFFREDFDQQLEDLVESKLADMLMNTTARNTSILDSSRHKSNEEKMAKFGENSEEIEFNHKKLNKKMDKLETDFESYTAQFKTLNEKINKLNVIQINALEENKRKFDENYEDFIDKYCKFNQKTDKLDTENDTQNDEITKIQTQIETLQLELKSFRNNSDEELAKKLQSYDSSPHSAHPLMHQMKSLEAQCEQISAHVDRVEQYTHQYILNFKNIINRGTRYHPERPTELIIDFLGCNLGIFIEKRDISICHRQDIPSERKRLGKNYIAPIYCKFLNRSLVHAILRKKHLLKNVRNEFNQPYFIEENLTLNRRLLWDSVEEKLGHFKFRWTKKGDIFVRENANAKVIKVINERVIEELAAKKALPAPSSQASPNTTQQHSKNKATGRNTFSSHIFSTRNRYADVLNSNNFPILRSTSLNSSSYTQPPQLPIRPTNSRPQLPFRSISRPLFRFKKTSFVDYRSSAY